MPRTHDYRPTAMKSPQLGKLKKGGTNMKYETPEITCVDDAAKSIQQMSKDQNAADNSNGTHQPPTFPADE